MNPRVTEVTTLEGCRLRLVFSNGERRIFDASPYLVYPAFKKLTNAGFFSLARPEHGTVVWPDNIDFCPDSLYVESVKEEQEEYGKFL
ncbi:MAG TPA: DUF2442 domain-containing protein [Desulfuromonadales bacterium]|nr:DUF2442 domain-containing protein [Desulfuromonadales bacterium]